MANSIWHRKTQVLSQVLEEAIQESAFGEYLIPQNLLEEGASFMRHKGDFSHNKVS